MVRMVSAQSAATIFYSFKQLYVYSCTYYDCNRTNGRSTAFEIILNLVLLQSQQVQLQTYICLRMQKMQKRCSCVYTHGRIRVLKKYQSGIIHRKLKVLLLVIFSQSLIQYTCWACSGASRCSWASPQGDTRGMLDYRLDFWGNICAPRQGLRGPHAGRYIMIIDLGGTSRGNQASTS